MEDRICPSTSPWPAPFELVLARNFRGILDSFGHLAAATSYPIAPHIIDVYTSWNGTCKHDVESKCEEIAQQRDA